MRERLTDKLLKGLESPATGQIDVWDKITPGFGIRVSMGGRKSFMVGTRINGKFRRITLKPAYDALTLAEARKKAQQILADAQAGIGPEQRKRREQAGTFGAVAAAFMQDYAKDHRTRDEMQRRINVDLADWQRPADCEDQARRYQRADQAEGAHGPDIGEPTRGVDQQDFQPGLEGGIDRDLASYTDRPPRQGDGARACPLRRGDQDCMGCL